MLSDGQWPVDPHDTGYFDSPGQRQVQANAYFTTPVGIAAEIKVRLERCGLDGTLARQNLADGWDEQTLAELMGTEVERLRRRVRRVVNYCSGWRRRRIGYNEFSRRRGISEAYKKGR